MTKEAKKRFWKTMKLHLAINIKWTVKSTLYYFIFIYFYKYIFIYNYKKYISIYFLKIFINII